MVLALHQAPAFAEAAPIVLRASVSPEGEIWVGQRITLHIDVLGRDGWAQIKAIRDFEVPGAFVVRTQTQGVRLNESIDGESYTGQRYELLLYPQRGGILSVPSVPVDIEVKTWGTDAETTTQRKETPPVEFEAKVPPGAEDVRGLISTTQLTAKQVWDPQPADFMVGDAIKRTVSLEAADVSGMAFVPMGHDPIGGVGVYPEEPSVRDESHRGSLTGKRVETVTYVFEKEGAVELPTVVIQWWNLQTRQLMREELEGLTLEIAPNPDLAVGDTREAATLAGGDDRPLWLLIPMALPVGLVVALWAVRRNLSAWFRHWRLERRESESSYFRRFDRAVASRDPKAALNALMRWLDRIEPGPGAARLDVFVKEFGAPPLEEESQTLHRIAMAPGDERWEGARLRRSMHEARKRWVASGRPGSERDGIPPLNPATGPMATRRR